MLKASRAQGMPMMVIAMMTAARTQPAAMYRPPKAIHNRLRKSAKADIGFFRGSRTMRPPGRHARDLETDAPVCQLVQPKLFRRDIKVRPDLCGLTPRGGRGSLFSRSRSPKQT